METSRLNAEELEIELFQFLKDNGVGRFFSLISNTISRTEFTKKAIRVFSPNDYTLTLIDLKLRDTFAGEIHEMITGEFNVVKGESKHSVLKHLLEKGFNEKGLEEIIANSCQHPIMVGVKTRKDFPETPFTSLSVIFGSLKAGDSFLLEEREEKLLSTGEKIGLGMIVSYMRRQFNLETIEIQEPLKGTIYRLSEKTNGNN